jgi:hypothetical protein
MTTGLGHTGSAKVSDTRFYHLEEIDETHLTPTVLEIEWYKLLQCITNYPFILKYLKL